MTDEEAVEQFGRIIAKVSTDFARQSTPHAFAAVAMLCQQAHELALVQTGDRSQALELVSLMVNKTAGDALTNIRNAHIEVT